MNMRTLPGLVLIVLLGVTALPAAEDDGFTPIFNGKDLTNFYTYLKGEGKNKDPKKVFTVKDGMIRVSGEQWGAFITEKDYENYHLVVEFKWGEKTWGAREKATRDSGLLVHCVGDDGAAGGSWLESVEFQIIEGGTGDFILVKGKNIPTLTVEAEQRGEGKPQWYYKPGAPAKEFKGGRINWYGRDPKWKDVKGYRGPDDVEKPVGEWNRLECICKGGSITNIVNGKVVNAGTKCSHTKGKILLQSEGAEIFFRKIAIKPIK